MPSPANCLVESFTQVHDEAVSEIGNSGGDVAWARFHVQRRTIGSRNCGDGGIGEVSCMEARDAKHDPRQQRRWQESAHEGTRYRAGTVATDVPARYRTRRQDPQQR
ncbi:hypothetical protein E2562_023012 [Oryza meyeriana var. granulata]|uniref:Uncharacterized protein n=1 Tax=Oryza meyeriana var. granulata TaxID=110450 RepID=A0A6G1EYA3_9ORYZ|nr:hypothetical protein E2562_023012 [Oryza meyeriana var. granulata]